VGSGSVNDLRLEGCRPEPLGSYLKALGVIRLVRGQADPAAKCFWADDTFVLRTVLDRLQLVEFFLDRYVPTPLVSPWNGGSGFGPKDRKTGIEAIEGSDLLRLAPYREAIHVARGLFDEAGRKGWSKDVLLEACRARLPEAAVEWMDAAVALAAGGPAYPPLLGTGGNDGRFEFSNNFMQRVAEVLALAEGRGKRKREQSEEWLQAALFADRATKRPKGPIGQFDPGSAGGVNSSPFGSAESLVDPWDWVLLLEGALLFAGAAARRLGAGSRGRAAAPFTFGASAVGYTGSAVDETSRGEIWVPLWPRPASAEEIAQLIGEARAEWRGRPARRGVDMVRAVSNLGVDRGIDRFNRFALVERLGRNTLAVAAGRVPVLARPEVPLLAQLDAWVDAARRGREAPAGVRSSVGRIDAAMYELALHGGASRLQHVLVAAADAELVVGRASNFRERVRLGPVSGLVAADWVPRLNDGSHDFRVALALASARDRDGACLRYLLRPIARDRRTRRPDWTEGPEIVSGLGARSVTDLIAAVHFRRALRAAVPAQGAEDAVADSGVGIQTAFRFSVAAPLASVAAFVAGELDDARIGNLLGALMLLDWREEVLLPRDVSSGYVVPPPAWALLAPFFHARKIKVSAGREVVLRPEASWPAQLAAGRVQPVVEAALGRLRVARLEPALTNARAVAAAAPPGPRLAAALLMALSTRSVQTLLSRAVLAPIEKEVLA
jgi:CRISPR-associated protein Csx17